MKSYRKELWFETNERRKLINITPQIERELYESGIKEGLLLCNAMHIILPSKAETGFKLTYFLNLG